MRHATLAVLAAAALVIAPGCKKKGGAPGPGGWLVGDEGLMAAIASDGSLAAPYELGTSVNLAGIACRGTTDAFVVGAAGTFLRTFDGGESWEAIDVGTTADLHAVAADANGSVIVAGDDALYVSHDSGGSFAAIAAGRFTSVAMSDAGLALALDTTGTVFRIDSDGARDITRIASGRVASLSHRGTDAAITGDGGVLARSSDGGATWSPLAPQPITLNAAWLASDGTLLAVGAAGDDGLFVDETSTTVVSNAPLRALHIDAAGAGLAAGDSGTILATDDGGDTWRALDLGITTTIRGLDQLDGHGHW